MKNGPLVSVVIPTQNRDIYLAEAIKSVDEQTYPNIEIIVVDDASKEPVDLSNFHISSSIKLIRNDLPIGGAGARNIGFDNSTGEYVCFLDDDDLYDIEKIETLVSVIESNSADVAFGSIVKFKESIPGKFLKNKKAQISEVKNYSYISKLHTNSSLIKRECFKNVQFLTSLKKYQDTQLHLEFIHLYKVVKVNKVVAYWRQGHDVKRITDVNNQIDIEKTLNAYMSLKLYLGIKYPNDLLLLRHLEKTYLRMGIKFKLDKSFKARRLLLKYPIYSLFSYIFYIGRS